jgi:hypothetical protein
MPTTEQKKKLLKAKIAVALHDELGRVPKKEEIEQVFLLARVMYKAILGLHYRNKSNLGSWRSSKYYAHWLRPGLNPRTNHQSPTRRLRQGWLHKDLHRYRQWGKDRKRGVRTSTHICQKRRYLCSLATRPAG